MVNKLVTKKNKKQLIERLKKFQENLMEEENILIDGWQFGYNKEVVQNVKDDITQRFEKNWSWKDWLCRFFTFYLKRMSD